jgi:hypothetical protein
MSTLASLKSNLLQKPNPRERLIFIAALLVFVVVFFKACVVENRNVASELQGELDKAVAEQNTLKAQSALNVAIAKKQLDAKSNVTTTNWIGSKKAASSASDALVKAAQDHGILMVRFSLPDYKEKSNFLFKPISLTLAGTLGDLERYIDNSEHLEVPLVIEHLSIDPNSEFPDLVTLRIEGGFYAEK